MKVYAISDIHGCLQEFEEALSLVDLQDPENKLVLLGDYVHCGPDSHGVLDKIMSLQRKYGSDRVIVLLGNHEEMVLEGRAPIQENWEEGVYDSGCDDEKYMLFLQNLPLYHTEGNTIFVHAGVDETAGEDWEWESSDRDFTEKFPAETGQFDCEMKIVAGHVGTAEVAGNPRFHDIYYDGMSHYYIDGAVYDSGVMPVLMVDTDEERYYQVIAGGIYEIEPYEE